MYARIGLGALVFVVIGWFLFSENIPLRGSISNMLASSALPASGDTGEPFVVPPLKNEYRNQQFGFSLSLPEGFRAGELPVDENGAHTILLQNPQGQGIQILITPYPDDIRVLTADMIRHDIPDMKISDVQPVEIGPDHRGVAFKSDNEAFGGDSREVWFIFRGNLYQISTYAHLDNLLQTLFGTWQFF